MDFFLFDSLLLEYKYGVIVSKIVILSSMPVQVKCPLINFFGLQTPFRCGLFGSSRTGKTTAIHDLLKNKMFDSDFEMIYYCYPSIYDNELDWHETLDYNIEYLDFIPTAGFISEIEKNSLLILDDCWYSCTQDNTIRDLFKVVSGKKDLSIFITSQNPYEGGSHARTLRNNMNYFMLFRNLGDHQINKRLSQQLGVMKQYEHAAKTIKSPYGFVFINMDVRLENEKMRVASNIFDQPIITA